MIDNQHGRPAAADLGEQRLNLGKARNGLQREDVDTGFGQQLDPWAVPGSQFLDGEVIVAAVLRAVGQRRAVGPTEPAIQRSLPSSKRARPARQAVRCGGSAVRLQLD